MRSVGLVYHTFSIEYALLSYRYGCCTHVAYFYAHTYVYRRRMKDIMKKFQIGNWFVLYQVSKNFTLLHFNHISTSNSLEISL